MTPYAAPAVPWSSAMPPAMGLYDPELEKDACGVGFVCSIKGKPSHAIAADARYLLCNMTHRGAVGADIRDGDGAGVMTSIPHAFFAKTCGAAGVTLPPPGEYAVGNLFFRPVAADGAGDAPVAEPEAVARVEALATELGLTIRHWRRVPVDSSLLGPTSKSREPVILQPFVVPEHAETPFGHTAFQTQLFQLRKRATHALRHHGAGGQDTNDWFYVCSLATHTITYKGQLSPVQVYDYFADLTDPDFAVHFCVVHSRFSTNTFPSWDRAQPLRWLAHNGEINTLRGNRNWMRAREGVMHSERFKDALSALYPIVEPGGSDSAAVDNVLELLIMNGVLTLPEAMMVMVPEAWQNHTQMEPEKKAFYEWAACLMEPWDGPALFAFSDGRYVGACLDRNGLRPCRFYVTDDDRMICASEVGAIAIAPEIIASKGRLQPGKMLLVDTQEGRIVDDRELKMTIATRRPFQQWVAEHMVTLDDVRGWIARSQRAGRHRLDKTPVASDRRMLAFGFTMEQLNMLVTPMVCDGKESLGSMGVDTPLACLSRQPRLLYDYFRQLFAQVTNPPIDPIREEIVMSLTCYVGPQGNILETEAAQAHRLKLPSPLLSLEDLSAIKQLQKVLPTWPVAEIDITFPRTDGPAGYRPCLERVKADVLAAIDRGMTIAILSDRNVGPDRVPLSALAACAGVHHHLVTEKKRSRIALFIETGEAREVHHFCVLLGFGADAITPYLALEACLKLRREGLLPHALGDETIVANFIKASNDGIKKVMSKMGISTLQSYKGAQIFEALGLDHDIVNACFAGTASRIRGVDFAMVALDAFAFHELAWPTRATVELPTLPESGDYHWRDGGEPHINSPNAIASLQDAVRRKNQTAYDTYASESRRQIANCTLRGALDFAFEGRTPVPLDEVEPWTAIVKRFCTGAMSYGSISIESHSTLAIAMNRLGGKSNTGEGGEAPVRSARLPSGDTMRSSIKQVASGRFGVTSYYLSDSEEIQIKLAQGAKPGEGGELPGYKVSAEIASVRGSTPGVGLISPPPHHDIYSIEDLKQLIYDLKAANPNARISVKLVSEVGVGIVASGVAKAKADHILISGHDGGTGASRWTGIKNAGLPWELGLAETHQTLVLNDLRGRVILQTDGQLKTGRDVAIACLLGAEEWGFATAPLIAMGCVLLRKCHLSTCAVGIATQDAELRKKFQGQPEHVINFFFYVAEEMRSIMARLGFRSVNEMVGRSDCLRPVPRTPQSHPKSHSLDLTALLTPAHTMRPGVATYCVRKQDHAHHNRLDHKLIADAQAALGPEKQPVICEARLVNTDRCFGATLSYEISKRHGPDGLPPRTIHVHLSGSAGQSFGAFLAPGVLLELEGDSNDYVGKGLSGGELVIYPPRAARFRSEENILIGNVCLYGATAGKAFFRGIAAERFCVRNSGAIAVVEGVGDHGCEYMTGGRCIVLGSTGRNFAAGMSGGIAYVLDITNEFPPRCNPDMVDLERVDDPDEVHFLRQTIDEHRRWTQSPVADRVLRNWDRILPRFVKVYPRDYKRVIEADKAAAAAAITTIEPVSPIPMPAERPPQPNKAEPAIADLEDEVPDLEAQERHVRTLDKVRGFMKYAKRVDPYRNPVKRVKDWKEISARLRPAQLSEQAARCMDCGVPFCQSDSGCPLGNIIPKWNDLVFRGQWQDALHRLLLTNNFPEFTGRVCPAPCEGACTLGINAPSVSIKSIECAIIDRGFAEGHIVPNPPAVRTGKTVAIVGSGPAGLAAADQLNKAGHTVTVYDRNDRHGGLLMYGIPNMKLDKAHVQRRVDLLAAEGVAFVANAEVGKTVAASALRERHDAVLLAVGATWPRDLKIPNRELDGIHFAMTFLQRNTKSLLDASLQDGSYLSAKGKRVVVIGGGDTGNDCIGTAVRHGCASVVNFELLPSPPSTRAVDNPRPTY
ncbi:putative glutamate synthase Glt1, partial [Caulochytrium protostelioides]